MVSCTKSFEELKLSPVQLARYSFEVVENSCENTMVLKNCSTLQTNNTLSINEKISAKAISGIVVILLIFSTWFEDV